MRTDIVFCDARSLVADAVAGPLVGLANCYCFLLTQKSFIIHAMGGKISSLTINRTTENGTQQSTVSPEK